MEKTKRTIMRYKFRAECKKDVLSMLDKLPNVDLKVEFSIDDMSEPTIVLESFNLQGLKY